MPALANQPLPLHDWAVLSLRPRGQHAGLRKTCTRYGARLVAISTLAIHPITDAAARQTLREALAADCVLFTSPNAVTAAAQLAPLHAQTTQHWIAVGEGTRRALQRHGIDAIAPSRMDSEGLLALPQLRGVAHRRAGLITAPGGRGVLEPTLRERGANVIRANVYQRTAIALTARQRARLHDTLQQPQRVALALSSGEALQALLQQAPPSALKQVLVLAASARLAQQAREAGFTRIATASSARPAALLHAATEAVCA